MKVRGAVADQQSKLAVLQKAAERLPTDVPPDKTGAELKARLSDASRELDSLKTAIGANAGPALDKALEEFPRKYVIPVDLHIAGCPPTPKAMLQGLLALLDHADTGAS